MALGELGPARDGGFAGLVARVAQEELAFGVVVGHRVLGPAVAQVSPRQLLFAVFGAVDLLELADGGVLGDVVEHAAGADRGELAAVADRDQLRARPLDQARERVPGAWSRSSRPRPDRPW